MADEISGADSRSTDDLLSQIQFEDRERAKDAGPDHGRRVGLGLGALALLAVVLYLWPTSGPALDFGWRSSLVGVRPPEGRLTGVLEGALFEVESASLVRDTKTLTLRAADGRSVQFTFACPPGRGCPLGRAYSFPRPARAVDPKRRGPAPPALRAFDADARPRFSQAAGYVLSAKFPADPAGELAMYLCFAERAQGFLGGRVPLETF